MKKALLAAFALAALTVPTGWLAVDAPATAGTATGPYGSLTAADATAFPDQCVYEQQHLSVAYPENAQATITGPGGAAEFTSFDGSGAGTVFLCGSTDPAGIYNEHVALYDASYNYIGSLDTTFTYTQNTAQLATKVLCV